jgi:glycosyltransferase involved in cell wall biosynthesis
MRILLISNYVGDSQESMQRYAALLQDGFTGSGQEVRSISPPVTAGGITTSEAAKKWFGYIDKLVLFPRILKKALEWADIVHICDHSNALYLKYIGTRPHVITCHDLLAVRSALGEFPQNRTRWSGRKLQRLILDGLARSQNIVCVSDATRADFVRLVPCAGKRVTRVYNGLNYSYSPMEHRQATIRLQKLGLGADQRFLLHVGGNQWYKNRLGVLRIFAHLNRRATAGNLAMVMVGKSWTEEMRQFAQRHEIERHAIELTDVVEEDLRALYSTAEALLFPSLEEGFGWPIVEASACGCPVVTSNRAPMTEVGDGAALYIDPLDHEAAAIAVMSVLGSRQAIRERCMRSAARFSAASMIDSYLNLYVEVLGRGTYRVNPDQFLAPPGRA